jgi:uncharacterized protein YjiS (DUF1127 family)
VTVAREAHLIPWKHIPNAFLMEATMSITHPIARRRRAGSGFGGLLLTWSERLRHRRTLRQLDDHLLSDIGLSRALAEAESQKPFWRA